MPLIIMSGKKSKSPFGFRHKGEKKPDLPRDEQIIQMRNSGATYRKIAKVHGLSIPRIQQIVTAARQDPVDG